MKIFNRLFLTFVFAAVLGIGFDANSRALAGNDNLDFSEVWRIIESKEGQVYVVTNNGTWELHGNNLRKVDESFVAVVPLESVNHLMPNTMVGAHKNVQAWAGIAISLMTAVLAFSFIYYQRMLRRKKLLEQQSLQKQQQLLDIIYWASGDTVLDCDLERNTTRILNDQSQLNPSQDVHLLSEEYLERVHLKDRPHVQRQIASLRHGGSNNYELSYRLMDELGRWRWIVERGCVMQRDQSGKTIRLIVSQRDETQLQQEQESLGRLVTELQKRLKLAEASK